MSNRQIGNQLERKCQSQQVMMQLISNAIKHLSTVSCSTTKKLRHYVHNQLDNINFKLIELFKKIEDANKYNQSETNSNNTSSSVGFNSTTDSEKNSIVQSNKIKQKKLVLNKQQKGQTTIRRNKNYQLYNDQKNEQLKDQQSKTEMLKQMQNDNIEEKGYFIIPQALNIQQTIYTKNDQQTLKQPGDGLRNFKDQQKSNSKPKDIKSRNSQLQTTQQRNLFPEEMREILVIKQKIDEAMESISHISEDHLDQENKWRLIWCVEKARVIDEFIDNEILEEKQWDIQEFNRRKAIIIDIETQITERCLKIYNSELIK